jgi:hypothetical protein
MLQKWDSEGKMVDALELSFEIGIESLVMKIIRICTGFRRVIFDIYVFWVGLFCFVVLIVLVVLVVFRILFRSIIKVFFQNQHIKIKGE